MKRHESYKAVCPFYRSQDPQRICCEGITDYCSTHQAFGDSKRRKEYSKNYCYSNYEECPHAQTLLRLYEETEKNIT